MKQIEIELNGKTYVMPFGLGYLGECLENLKLNVFEIGQKLDDNPFKWIPTLMYESIKYDYSLDNKEVDFTYRDLIGWLDNEEGRIKMNTFLTAFVQSLSKDVPKEEETSKKGSKKK